MKNRNFCKQKTASRPLLSQLHYRLVIKATAYRMNDAEVIRAPCDDKDKIIVDVKAGETKSFDIGSVYVFKFSKV